MSQAAIKARGLGKEYTIGSRQHGNETFREMLIAAMSTLFRSFGNSDAPPEHDRFWALRDINFDIQPGEVVGIIGQNGAGKSTLLKVLSRITEPTRGEVSIRGRVASLLEVGTGFHPELTGRENIYLNGAILGMARTEIKRKFDEIVAFAEIDRFLDTPVKRYSSGMYVRLAFAVAAHLEPEIMLIDEVLAVGDAQFQKKCLGKIENVAKTGRTVLFVSHNMAAVQRLCKRGILLSQGQIAMAGPVRDCVERYLAWGAAEEQTGRSLELSCLPTSGWDGFRFLRITAKNCSGEVLSRVSVGEPFEIEVQFELARPHRDLIVGFAVRTSDEVPLFATHNNDFGGTYSLSAGQYSVRMTFSPNYLRPGRYAISLGAISSGVLVAHLSSTISLIVEPVLTSNVKHIDDRVGAMFIPMQWSEPEKVARASS